MLQTLAITAPIFLIVALGYGAVRAGAFARADIRVLGAFAIKVALPALIFTGLAQHPIQEILNGGYLLAYGFGSLAVLGVSFAWGRWVQRKPIPICALSALGMANSNSAFIAYPLAAQFVGAGPAAVALSLNFVIENIVIIPLSLIVADSGAQGEGARFRDVIGKAIAQQARNPFILAIVAGFIVSLIGVPIPDPVTRTISMLSSAAIGVALFVNGGALVGITLKGFRGDIFAITLGKLVLHPTVVGVLGWFFLRDDPVARTAAVTFAAAPMMSIFPILGQRYGLEGFCAAALLVTVVASFVTVSAAFWLLGPAGLGWAPG